jgi:hypothetical protein
MEDKHSKNGWTRIGGIRSESKPAEFYILAVRTGGALGCDCRSMIYRKGTKAHEEFEHTCKHIRAMLDGTVAIADFDPTPFGTVYLQKRLATKIAKAAV